MIRIASHPFGHTTNTYIHPFIHSQQSQHTYARTHAIRLAIHTYNPINTIQHTTHTHTPQDETPHSSSKRESPKRKEEMRLYPSDWRRSAAPIPTPTRPNLGPLTTVFVPPPHCTRAALSGSNAVFGQSCSAVDEKTATPADDTGCWPRATAYPTPAAGKPSLAGMGFYSPGLLCPTGYVSACTAVSATKGASGRAPEVTGRFMFPLVAGETAVGWVAIFLFSVSFFPFPPSVPLSHTKHTSL